MTDLSINRNLAVARGGPKSYGNATFESSYAHQGDVYSDLNVAGSLHLHFHGARDDPYFPVEFKSPETRMRSLETATLTLNQTHQLFDFLASNGKIRAFWAQDTTPVKHELALLTSSGIVPEDPTNVLHQESLHLASLLSNEEKWCSEWSTLSWKVLHTIIQDVANTCELKEQFLSAVDVVTQACKAVRLHALEIEGYELSVLFTKFLYDAVMWAANGRSGDHLTRQVVLDCSGFNIMLENLQRHHPRRRLPHYTSSIMDLTPPSHYDGQSLCNNNRQTEMNSPSAISSLESNITVRELLQRNGVVMGDHPVGTQIPPLTQVINGFPDPWQKTLFGRLALGRTRRIRSRQYVPLDTSVKRKLQHSCDIPHTNLCVLEGSLPQRTMLLDGHLEIINVVQQASIPVLYLLDPLDGERVHSFTTFECIKYLTLQLVHTIMQSENQEMLSYRLTQCQNTEDCKFWLQLLQLAAAGLPQLYVVVKLRTASGSSSAGSTPANLAFVEAIRLLIEALTTVESALSIKCIVLSDPQTTKNATDVLTTIPLVPVSIIKLPRKLVSGPAKRRLPPVHQRTKLLKLR